MEVQGQSGDFWHPSPGRESDRVSEAVGRHRCDEELRHREPEAPVRAQAACGPAQRAVWRMRCFVGPAGPRRRGGRMASACGAMELALVARPSAAVRDESDVGEPLCGLPLLLHGLPGAHTSKNMCKTQ